MKKPQGSMLHLLLRVAAAAVTGTVALVALRRFHRDQAVAALRRDIRDALLLLDGQPPVILVAGFRAYGKSSFVNTACRALAAETGPVILRSETAPPGPGRATLQCRVIRAAVARAIGEEEEEEEADGDDDEDAVVEMVDSPALPEPGRLTRVEAEEALFGNTGAPPPECVVLVIRCGGSRKERHVAVKKLTDVAAIVRERGLQLVVVLTHKKRIKRRRKAEEFRREIAFRARTDCVYFIENYIINETLGFQHIWTRKNKYDTHYTVLAIVRQCIEFAKLYRCNLVQRIQDEDTQNIRLLNR